MNNKYKTLRELNVQPGDVVKSDDGHTYVVGDVDKHECVLNDSDGWCLDGVDMWRIVSRAPSEEPPKLWRDMTPEEKGALLLAHHEGKMLQSSFNGEPWNDCTAGVSWSGHIAYRVRPEPKRETVLLYYKIPNGGIIKKIGTIDLIYGKPDKDSIKMEEL